MTPRKLLSVLLLGAGLIAASSASAITITPSFTTFGTLSNATFGGSGIPNTAVAISTVTSGKYAITLGLTATPRYNNPALTNNGAGIFNAAVGGDVSHGQPGYSLWNVGYYVDFSPDVSDFWANGYKVELFYDKNPAVGNPVSTSVLVEPSFFNGLTFDSQDSWNLGMGSLFGPGFNPNVSGEYSFALVVSKDSNELGRSAIKVIVGSPVADASSTVGLMGLALVGLAAVSRRRRS